MSLLRREPRPVYRVYAEEEYDGDTESVGAKAAEGEYAGDTESFRAEAQVGTHRPAPTAGSLELRRRPVAFLVVGLLVLLATVVVALVLSNISRRAPHRPVPAAPAVSTATAGHPLAAAAPPMPRSSTPSPPLRRSQRVRRPSATENARTDGDAPASALAPVPAPVERPLPDPPAPINAEFGFER